ncbi:hypothetical protein [Microbispora sp. CA-102843]|uniref:hypothetical protein n=1 Tax=Microbispora sp. CA-102843 TaxID=3239952 RepID=UPI003D9455CF
MPSASRKRIRPLAACQPYRDEIFLIVNETGENVVVTWSERRRVRQPSSRPIH